MGFFDRIFGKASEARKVLVMNEVGRAVSSKKNYEAFAKEGYQSNAIGYKCVSILSRACAGIEWELYQGDREIESHPLLDLLKNPNPMQSKSQFFEAVVAYFNIAGNSYIESVSPGSGPPMELWAVRPDKMSVVGGPLGLPLKYCFKAASGEKYWDVDQVTGQSEILHMKTFHPTDAWYGMSPIEAAMYSVDQHNESGKWNLSLLQNMGTPSGALVMEQSVNNPTGTIPEPQFKNLESQLNSKFAGSKNAGRLMLLEGGMKWQSMGFSAKDMDWMEGRKMSARDIALAFGVPPIILNIPGDSTFANYKEARLALYEDTILPMLDMIQDELNHWLVPMFGDGLELRYDKDDIPALEQKRMEKFSIMSGVTFITTNEKRDAIGYEPVDGGDEILVNSGQMPLSTIGSETSVDAENPEQETTQEENWQAQEDSEDGEKSNHKFSQVNLVNQKEKAKSLRDANALKDKLTSAMYHDLKEDFADQARALKNGLDNIDPRVMEFAAVKILSDSTAIEKTIKKHIKRAMNIFGQPILNGAKSIGVNIETKNTIKFQQFVDSFIQKHTAQAVTHIEGTSIKKARRYIKDIIADSQESGISSAEIAKQLEAQFNTISTSRANMIARTEIGIASNQGSLEAAKSLEIPDLMKEWNSTNDDRTRDMPEIADHLSANGQRVGLNEKFAINPDAAMDSPGDPSAPPEQIINCILPGQFVSGYFVSAIKSEYVGTVFELKTKSGRKINVTPNHPIATENGLIPACEINERTNLIVNKSKIWDASGWNNNVKNKPVLIEDVFHSIHVLGNSLTTNLLANDLHGDGKFIKPNVNIVTTDRNLLATIETALKERFKNLSLVQKDRMAHSESRNSPLVESNVGINRTSSFNPSVFTLSFNEDGISLNGFPFNGLAFGLSSEFDSILQKISRNSATIKPKLFSDLVNRHSSNVFFDPVVEIREVNYSGHVYDLQSNSGLMQVDGIVTSNCRCGLVYSRDGKSIIPSYEVK
jgi:HK97 family phage portal protein